MINPDDWICYNLYIMCKDINILIEKDLYQKNMSVFKGILVAFKRIDVINTYPDSCFICAGNNIYLSMYEHVINCHPAEDKWIHELIVELEVYFISIMKQTVFHGSCFETQHRTVMLLGSRMSGKSTLLEHLVHNKNIFLLDDDCIFFDGHAFYGFNMPIRMRIKPQGNIINTTVDDDEVNRYLVIPSNRKNYSTKKLLILFPQYDINDCYHRQITGNELFMRLIKNVRKASNNKTRLQHLSQLTRESTAFEIKYTSCNQASDFLKELEVLE